MINLVQRLYDKVFQFFSSVDSFSGGKEALDDGGEDGNLTEFQVAMGLGFCLRVLQILWMNVRALTTLERLWLRSRRLVMRSEDGSEGTVAIRLMVLEGKSLRGRDVHFLIGQEDCG